MQTDPQPTDDPQAQHLHRMVSSFAAINVRIARLAIGLGASLKSDGEVLRLMRPHQAPAAPSKHASDLRSENQWRELRGLLVLRYSVETDYVDKVGVIATRQILVEAEQHLLRKGFHLGDDGIAANLLFNEP